MNVTSEQSVSQSPVPDVSAVLRASPLFTGLGRKVTARLALHTTACRLRVKDTLFVQGAPADVLFVLCEGSMKLVRRTGHAREHVVRLVQPGELLAECALLSKRTYPETAVAVEESRLLAINARHFVACMGDTPALAWQVTERLGTRIEELQARAELLATHTAEQKVAAYLLRRYQALPKGEAVVASSCRRSDIASLLALAPETLCRVITEFKRRGWIQGDSGRIVVIDAGSLAGVAP